MPDKYTTISIPCIELEKYMNQYGVKVVHVVHAPLQCGFGILTDKMILVLKNV